jgi:L-rhamnose mutarotase
MKRYVLTLDLKRDRAAVRAYDRHHRAVWPEVLRSLRRVGVRRMDIFRLEHRLVMFLETSDDFDLKGSFARHVASDPRCRDWEALMKTFQRAPPGAAKGALWTEMKLVFRFGAQWRALRGAKAARPTGFRGARG